MKREKDLILKLLLKLEEFPARPGDMFLFSGTEPELAIEGYSSDQIEYHLTRLKSEGYIDSPGSQPMQGITFRSLSSRGHDMVDQYREAQAADEIQNWISAADAVSLLISALKSQNLAQKTICKRAHGGLIHSRAERFIVDGVELTLTDESGTALNVDIEKHFWWAEGNAALHQNWVTGDFDTWIYDKTHLQAFGVSFLRTDIEKMIPSGSVQRVVRASPVLATGGRPPADWWDDLWVEICRQIYAGELVPKRQAEIQKAMQQWCSDKGYSDAASTIRPRASKLWNAVFAKGEN
jgi:hypothetical protein